MGDDKGGLSLFSTKSPFQVRLRKRAGLVFRGLLFVDVHEVGLVMRKTMEECGSAVRKIGIGAQGQGKFVGGEIAPVIAFRVQWIGSSQLDFLKCSAFQDQFLKLGAGETFRKTPF